MSQKNRGNAVKVEKEQRAREKGFVRGNVKCRGFVSKIIFTSREGAKREVKVGTASYCVMATCRAVNESSDQL